MTDTLTSPGWACTDCAMLVASGETPADMSGGQVTAWLAAIESRCAGCHVAPGLAREAHACRSNWTVTYVRPHRVPGSYVRGTAEVLAGTYAAAVDAARWHLPAGARVTVARPHDLAVASDFGRDCDCETDAFARSACDVCGSPLAGERHAVTFWTIVPAQVTA